jgi:hypothetical protein
MTNKGDIPKIQDSILRSFKIVRPIKPTVIIKGLVFTPLITDARMMHAALLPRYSPE